MSQDIAVVVEIPFDACARRGDSSRHAGLSVKVRTEYLRALEAEIEASEDLLAGKTIRSIEVRGSAAMVPVDDLGRFLGRFLRVHEVDPRGDYTVEMTCRTVGTPSLTGLNMARFRCLRLDAWTCDADTATYLGVEPKDVVANAIAYLEQFRYPRVSLRCLYGVPGVGARSVRGTVEALTESRQVKEVILCPYELAKDEGVAFEDLAEHYQAAAGMLAVRGYEEYAVGRFALSSGRDGSLLNRLAGMDVAGFGAGAWSRVGGIEYRNTPDVAAYTTAGGAFEQLVCFARELGDDDRAAEQALAQLQLLQAADEGALDAAGVAAGIEAGLLERTASGEGDGPQVRLTALGRAGFPFVRELLSPSQA